MGRVVIPLLRETAAPASEVSERGVPVLLLVILLILVSFAAGMLTVVNAYLAAGFRGR